MTVSDDDVSVSRLAALRTHLSEGEAQSRQGEFEDHYSLESLIASLIEAEKSGQDSRLDME